MCSLLLMKQAYQRALSRCGYYPLLTDQQPEQLSIEEAMLAHKKQYKSEHTYRRAKGPYEHRADLSAHSRAH